MKAKHGTCCKLTSPALVSVLFLALAGCGALADRDISIPNVRLSALKLPSASEGFQRRYYAGASFGSSSINPDTSSTAFTADSQSVFASQLRFGYDYNDRLSFEFDSSQLGEAELDQGVAAVKYSSFSASALIYGLTNSENRVYRRGLSAYGRLGYAYNRHSSNVTSLSRNETRPVIGIGAEYGLKNGLGLRAEVTRYDSESTYLGLGAVLRFDSFKRFIPQHMVQREEEGVSVYADGREYTSQPTLSGQIPVVTSRYGGNARMQVDYVKPLKVTMLANANDHDADGVPNDADECPGTVRTTAVSNDGCGLFDGTLANSTFASGSAKLTQSTKAALDHLAVRLLAFPEVRLSIEAYTDNKGPADINLNVSRSRAEMVRQYLVRKGVAYAQLDIQGLGEARQIADNSTAAGRDANRRIEFLTLPSMTTDEINLATKVAASAAVSRSAAVIPKLDDALGTLPVLAAAKTGINRLPAPHFIPGLRVNGVFDGVEFKLRSAVLSDTSRAAVIRLSQQLQQNSDARIAIMAHTNYMDSAEQNLQLSVRQARTLMKALVVAGVSRRQLRAEGYGDTLPRIQGLTERHRQFNRRVELRLIQ